MIRDATPIFRDPDVNLAAPGQMLTLLRTTGKPFYIFFTASKDPETGKLWSTDAVNALFAIHKVFRKHNVRHHIATVTVGGEEEWEDSSHPVRKRWKITHIPTIAKFQLLHKDGEAFYHSRKLIGAECVDENKLRLLRDGPFEGIPSDYERWRAKFYESEWHPDNDGWKYHYVGVPEPAPQPRPRPPTIVEMLDRDDRPSRQAAPSNVRIETTRQAAPGFARVETTAPVIAPKVETARQELPKVEENINNMQIIRRNAPKLDEGQKEILEAVRKLVGPIKHTEISKRAPSQSSSTDDSIFQEIYDVVPRRASPK
ncbi:hypothetical protein ABW21_db0208918 [Orbilia brochopaga]|nr:hypothetical protein ABW21_db0208918 [Drechslerella brochopaga]